VTRSRKLILAAALLAGGYGLAILLSGVSDYLWPRHSAMRAGETWHGRGIDLDRGLLGRPSTDHATRLIPEKSNRTDSDVYRDVPALDRVERPLLPTTPDSGIRPELVGAPPAEESHDEVRSDRVEASVAEEAQRPSNFETTKDQGPRGRLVDVKLGAAIPSPQTASPWDRWPRWEPPVATASFDRAESTNLSATQASYGATSQRTSDQASPTYPFDVPAEDQVELRIHVVADGDSLSKLADRYLDDPQLADAIYQLNRDAVTDPELLPIGIELKIPPRRAAGSNPLNQPGSDRGRPAASSPLGRESTGAASPSSGAQQQPQIRHLPPVAVPASALSANW
jgi:hypothetical protein